MITITGLIILKVKYIQKLIRQFLLLLSKSGKIIVSGQMICG